MGNQLSSGVVGDRSFCLKTAPVPIAPNANKPNAEVGSGTDFGSSVLGITMLGKDAPLNPVLNLPFRPLPLKSDTQVEPSC